MSNRIVVSRIVCWKCKKGGQKGDAPLRKITKVDYLCSNCEKEGIGAPETSGQSEIYFTRNQEVKQVSLTKEEQDVLDAALNGRQNAA